ncbi:MULTISPECIES: helix-turn-helix domain-containing protein [Lacticaseibacillus]|uniref:helix-turn-helix domain-containing protein n=1 Tax=Lacticaseibacillus TaxID=2759736 RepID=UPI00063DC595|nr:MULTISPECIES: helix-turn-helix transcriptional regulator [Lacticaseibacillus]KLI77048.1 XRE family transcriptional regulator [Lacticaseibacillus casei]
MQLSDKLKLARQQQHLTQTQVAEQLHVSAKTISSWENARSFPDVGTLVSISDFYNISLDQLLREDFTMMEHYETISKQAQRDKWYFKITYYLNVIFVLSTLALKTIPNNLETASRWVLLASIINLMVLATHYPNYHAWIEGKSRRILLGIFLALGIIFLIMQISISGFVPRLYPGTNHLTYLVGFYIGTLLRSLLWVFSICFMIFGFAELKEKP